MLIASPIPRVPPVTSATRAMSSSLSFLFSEAEPCPRGRGLSPSARHTSRRPCRPRCTASPIPYARPACPSRAATSPAPGARRPDRVPDRDRATIHVHPRRIPARDPCSPRMPAPRTPRSPPPGRGPRASTPPVPTPCATRGSARCPITAGSTPTVAKLAIRASGVSPRRFASAADITTSAAAPSFSPLAFPAVTVPSLLNAGRSLAIISAVLSWRIYSSSLTTMSPLRPLIVTGVISSLNRPLFCARHSPCVGYATANASCCSRVDLELRCHVLGRRAHVVAVERVPQPVLDHRVDQASGRPSSCPAAEIRRMRRLAHALLPARDDNRTLARSGFAARRAPPSAARCRRPG